MTPQRALAAVAVIVLLAVAGCGGDDGASPAETAVATGTAVETAPAGDGTVTDEGERAMTNEGDETTSGSDDGASPATEPNDAAEAVKTISIVVTNAQPEGGIARPVVQKGDRVKIVVRSDGGEYVHLHGYDVEKPVVAGKPVTIAFTATIPGRFELEQHNPSVVLAEIEVRP